VERRRANCPKLGVASGTASLDSSQHHNERKSPKAVFLVACEAVFFRMRKEFFMNKRYTSVVTAVAATLLFGVNAHAQDATGALAGAAADDAP